MGKSTVVRGTPVNHIGPKGAGNTEGRTPGMPADLSGTTVKNQYRGDGVGIDTRLPPGSGTPYVDREGNPDETRRVVSSDPYGISPGAGGVDYNDPAANGTGVVFDGATRANGNMPTPARSLDSPVSRNAPFSDNRSIAQQAKERLGSGNEGAMDGLVEGGGVMGR